MKPRDKIEIKFKKKEPLSLKPQDIPLEIIYEDDDLVVVNKPSGMVAHPAPGNLEGTLVNALLFHCKELSLLEGLRPGIVHRLDKDASGVMVVAKNNSSYLSLIKQFRQHTIKRKYVAVVLGKVQFDEGVIDVPIARDPFNYQKMSVRFSDDAKESRTNYRTLKRTDEFSLLELTPETGRTHQIRVHLKYLGHPILGDTKYGQDQKSSRLFLHSTTLGFTHPRTKKVLEFNIPMPCDRQIQVLNCRVSLRCVEVWLPTSV